MTATVESSASAPTVTSDVKAAKSTPAKKKTPAKKAAKKSADVLTPRQALTAVPMKDRHNGKFPLNHALGAFAKLFGGKNADSGTVQLSLDKARAVKHSELVAVCPKDVAVDNTIAVLNFYGTKSGKWHLTRDGEAKTVTLIPGKK